jgi:hypothetical protein
MELTTRSFYETDLGVGRMTAADLDAIALRGGRVGEIGGGYATTGKVGRLAGGWAARWIATRGHGNEGTLVLVPTDARTRALAREGRIARYMRAGLSRQQAERLDALRGVPYKAELAGRLAEALRNDAQRRALLAHPRAYGPGSGRSAWVRAWGPVFGPDGLGLSAPREAALAAMVAACAAA